MKYKKEEEETTNSSVYRKVHRELNTGCSRCPPHGGENASHGNDTKKKKIRDFKGKTNRRIIE